MINENVNDANKIEYWDVSKITIIQSFSLESSHSALHCQGRNMIFTPFVWFFFTNLHQKGTFSLINVDLYLSYIKPLPPKKPETFETTDFLKGSLIFVAYKHIYLQPPCALFLHAFHEIWHHMQKDHLFSKSAVICKRHIFWLWPFFQVEISSNVWWFDSINEFPKPSSPLQGTTPPKISKHSKWLH